MAHIWYSLAIYMALDGLSIVEIIHSCKTKGKAHTCTIRQVWRGVTMSRSILLSLFTNCGWFLIVYTLKDICQYINIQCVTLRPAKIWEPLTKKSVPFVVQKYKRKNKQKKSKHKHTRKLKLMRAASEWTLSLQSYTRYVTYE